MKKLAGLTGAGISAERGLQTFRDKGGLWEKYDFQKLASIEGWRENPELVLEFYNIRRDLVRKAQPNAAHLALTQLERMYDVDIITQNVDDLHERAGSKHILHLHGEIMKARSSIDDQLIYELGKKNIKLGDKCEKGSQLRPHVVWFGESVPMMDRAIEIVSKAEIFIIIGTSLQVYPAASLLYYAPENSRIYLVDKNIPVVRQAANMTFIAKTAVEGVPELVNKLLEKDE